MNGFQLYGRYVKIAAKTLLQYPKALWARILSTIVVSVFDSLGIFILFAQFGSLGDWQIWEILTLFGVTSLSFGLAEWIVRGFDSFPFHIRTGSFDRMMLRPRATALQVIGGRFELFKIARVAVSGVYLAYGLAHVPNLGWADIGLVTLACFAGLLMYSGIFIIFSTLAFWTTDALHLVYIVTNGTIELSQYPMSVYEKPIMNFFTYIVPLTCMNYYPMLLVLRRGGEWWMGFTPLAAIPFLIISLVFWQYGTTRYRSTGS